MIHPPRRARLSSLPSCHFYHDACTFCPMAIPSFELAPPVRRSTPRPARDPRLLDAAMARASEGNAVDAVAGTLAYLFPDRPAPDLAKAAFSFTQGSSRVVVRLDGDDVVVTVPLVRLPAGDGAAAALRYVLARISAPGQIYQPRLDGDVVRLELREPLAGLHPAKLVEALTRMPAEADENDDLLIARFAALPIDRAPIAPLDASERADAEAIWRSHWRTIGELAQLARIKRSMFFLDELADYAYHRPLDALPIVGVLRSRLDDAAACFNDTSADPVDREDALVAAAEELGAIATEELTASLGHATYAVDPLAPGTAAVLTAHLGAGPHRDRVGELRAAGDVIDATLALVATFTYLLAEHTWSADVDAALRAALASAHLVPWAEAAHALAVAAEDVVARFGGVACPVCAAPLAKATRYCAACGADLEAPAVVVEHPVVAHVEAALRIARIDAVRTGRRWAFDGVEVWSCCDDHLCLGASHGAEPADLAPLLASEHAPRAFTLKDGTLRLTRTLHMTDVLHMDAAALADVLQSSRRALTSR